MKNVLRYTLLPVVCLAAVVGWFMAVIYVTDKFVVGGSTSLCPIIWFLKGDIFWVVSWISVFAAALFGIAYLIAPRCKFWLAFATTGVFLSITWWMSARMLILSHGCQVL
ncbi:MAG: hypothetical protein FWG80_04600 [Alphaproteobacteria bacterium]|nr:hypothetical protein [Alphaproteobacteria bacterium]